LQKRKFGKPPISKGINNHEKPHLGRWGQSDKATHQVGKEWSHYSLCEGNHQAPPDAKPGIRKLEKNLLSKVGKKRKKKKIGRAG